MCFRTIKDDARLAKTESTPTLENREGYKMKSIFASDLYPVFQRLSINVKRKLIDG